MSNVKKRKTRLSGRSCYFGIFCVNSARQRNNAKILELRSREDYCVISLLEFTNDHSEMIYARSRPWNVCNSNTFHSSTS